MTVGYGLRPQHVDEVIKTPPRADFVEAHSENYFGGGPLTDKLLQVRAHYPVSLHGVGLSLGRADGLERDHLSSLKELVHRVDPLFVSEHLSWSAYSHMHVPDLLPVPFTQEAFAIFKRHVNTMQDVLGRQILVENPSNYLAFAAAEMQETEFLNRLAAKTGCGLLMDINNIYVSAVNLGYSPEDYIKEIEPAHVKQFHLAGYETIEKEGEEILLDTHGRPVYQGVWDLYRLALNTVGDRPTLLEWDSNIPPLAELVAEMDKISRVKQEIQREERALHEAFPPSHAAGAVH
jgi:hypothetical protein